jgi:nucleoid-associated protein YgaU
MAKPNAQTGHGSSSGTADESALPNGETSRRGADEHGDAPKADWGIPNAKDESNVSRILGLVLVLVLVGVFSFIAYRKYNEARLHPGGDATAQGPITPQPPANSETAGSPNGEAPNAALAGANNPSQDAAGGASVASNSAGANPSQSAFQLEDSPNTNVPFHPRGASDQPAEQPAQKPAASGRPAQTAANDNDVNPFNDGGANASSPTANAADKNGSIDTNPANSTPMRSTAAKPVAPGGQSEPLFETPAQQPRAQNRRGNEQLAIEPSGPAARQESGRVSFQSQPIQTARGEPAAGNPAAPNPPSQNEPATNDLLNDSPKPAAIAKDDQQTAPTSAAPIRSKAPSAGQLDQDEPMPTAARREPSTAGPGSASSLDAIQSAQSSSAATVHVGQAPNPPAETGKGADNEDLFATKTSDARANSQVTPVPQARRSVPIADGTAAEAALNDAGDSYVVQPQDNFWTISRKKYGTARYFRALAELNKSHVPDPTRMRPGVKVSTPPTEILETRFAQFLPKGTAVEVASGERPAGKSGPTGFFTNADGKPMYRTGEKDTLSDIAARHLGRASRWIQIYEMNRDKLATPNQLKIGTELALPGDASNVAVTNDNSDRR